MNPELLLRPLPGATPCGPDLSFSVEFDRLQDLRREDDATIPRGELDAEPRRADWPAVRRLAEALLREQTKDLRLAAWWAEAAAKTGAYAGLADGLALYTGLCEVFWDEVHPQPEDGDAELRIGSISWLLGLVGACARQLPVLQQGGERYSLAEIGNLRQRARSDDEETAKPAREAWERVQRAASNGGLQLSLEAARRIAETLSTLQSLADTRLGADGPAFVSAREAMQDAVAGIERLAAELGMAGRSAPHEEEATHGLQGSHAMGVTADAKGTSPAMPTSRAQALAQLRLVADYFRRHEPHSPVAYLADRAAQWGDMPLHVWLRTVLKEPSALASLDELLGVNSAAPPVDA
jgi:type VI secretion system protein ImpA